MTSLTTSLPASPPVCGEVAALVATLDLSRSYVGRTLYRGQIGHWLAVMAPHVHKAPELLPLLQRVWPQAHLARFGAALFLCPVNTDAAPCKRKRSANETAIAEAYAEAQRNGHDLTRWRRVGNTRTCYCLRCHMTVTVERNCTGQGIYITGGARTSPCPQRR